MQHTEYSASQVSIIGAPCFEVRVGVCKTSDEAKVREAQKWPVLDATVSKCLDS